MENESTGYRTALDYVYSFTNFEVTPAGQYSSKTFDLTRMERLLAALGNPEWAFQSVHVAGTKGKGSTASMIEGILRAAGHRTGLYTSPHLHTFRERIRVDGEMISKADVIAGVARIRPIADALPQVTTFEIMTALAFDYFARRGIEFAVLEVGLGGRLDATNVVTPRVAVITSISYDHTAILGKTLSEIAREKAGIVKPDLPVVTSPQDPEALAVIQETARDKHAAFTIVTPTLEFEVAGLKRRLSSISGSGSGNEQTMRLEPGLDSHGALALKLPLAGHHQVANAATALAAIFVLRAQGVAISADAIRAGLQNLKWPGRFEVLAREPLVVVDGAHNGDSARQLMRTLDAVAPHAPIHLIFGASNDKDMGGMFAELLPHVTSLILTRSHNPRAADPAQLAERTAPYHVETSIAPDLQSALAEARARANKGDVICVTGSLFVVAEAREAWLKEHGQTVEKDA